MPNDPKSKKSSLESSIDRLDIWFQIATGAVALGLILEYGPKVWTSIREWKPPDHDVIGGILITIGVCAELWIEHRSGRKESELREINNTLLAEADLRAANADLERVKLEARLADRRVRDDQLPALADALKGFNGRRLRLYVLDEYEPKQFGNDIERALTKAGLNVSLSLLKPSPSILPGFSLFESPREADKLLADAIESALSLSGLAQRPVNRSALAQDDKVQLCIGSK